MRELPFNMQVLFIKLLNTAFVFLITVDLLWPLCQMVILKGMHWGILVAKVHAMYLQHTRIAIPPPLSSQNSTVSPGPWVMKFLAKPDPN